MFFVKSAKYFFVFVSHRTQTEKFHNRNRRWAWDGIEDEPEEWDFRIVSQQHLRERNLSAKRKKYLS